MGIKQRRLKPGRDFNYAEAVLAVAGEAISADDIVCVKGVSGGLIQVYQADATVASESVGKLFVAKHDIPSGGKGVVLPWKLVSVDTSAMSVGDRIYLKTTGTYGTTLSASSLVERVVGTVVKAATVVNGGKIMLEPNAHGVVIASTGYVPLSLMNFRIVSSGGDVGDTTANGGVLSSNTAPVSESTADKGQVITYAATGVVPIGTHLTLPADVDGANDVTVEIWVKKSGTTDAISFTVESGWDNGTVVSDTSTSYAAGSTALTKITATIAAADVPASPSNLSLILTPAAHGTDAFQIFGARIAYTKKLPNA